MGLSNAGNANGASSGPSPISSPMAGTDGSSDLSPGAMAGPPSPEQK